MPFATGGGREYFALGMSKLSVVTGTAALLATAVLAGGAHAGPRSGEGSLTVSGGRGTVLIQGQGLIFGHIGQGAIVVLGYVADDSSTPKVSGATAATSDGSTYSGDDLRFFFPNGRYSLQFTGSQIDISAVGSGSLTTIGAGTADDGSVAADGGTAQPFLSTATTTAFGGGTAGSRGDGEHFAGRPGRSHVRVRAGAECLPARLPEALTHSRDRGARVNSADLKPKTDSAVVSTRVGTRASTGC